MSRGPTPGAEAAVVLRVVGDRKRPAPPAIAAAVRSERTDDTGREYPDRLERILAERTAELTAANTRLKAANQEIEGFAHSLSHDLRAPLRVIDGFSRVLLANYADRLDSEGRRLLYAVRNNAAQMGNLIDDILAFSRVGHTEIQPVLLDMEALARGTLAARLAAAIAGRTLSIDIGELPPARGDRAMLGRVWANLLDNAIKFTAPRLDARIEVGATAGAEETVYYVRDNGVGFDMRRAGKLFGIFQRLHGSEFAGTGIGLALVKRIVARHGGRVWAEGKIGDGAVMYFALPTQTKT